MAPVVKALEQTTEVRSMVCVTAQQRQLLDQVLDAFSINPDFDLDIMKIGQTLPDIMVGVLQGLDRIFSAAKPDIVLVHGDTSTTFASALSAYYHKITVGHVEAGLRTNNIYSPWPEEINRRLTGTIATHHFAPTENAAENLRRENVANQHITVTGNTVIDALRMIVERLNKDSTLRKSLADQFSFLNSEKKLVLVTGHRRENFGAGFDGICEAINSLADRNDIEFIYPVHLNPNVQESVKKALGSNKKIHLIEPLDYVPFVYLMQQSHLILTDSGGVQEEAPSLGKPVLVMRETTERPEAVAAGTVRLVGTDANKIIEETCELLDNDEEYQRMAQAHNPYGDGMASKRIVEKIIELKTRH